VEFESFPSNLLAVVKTLSGWNKYWDKFLGSQS